MGTADGGVRCVMAQVVYNRRQSRSCFPRAHSHLTRSNVPPNEDFSLWRRRIVLEGYILAVRAHGVFQVIRTLGQGTPCVLSSTGGQGEITSCSIMLFHLGVWDRGNEGCRRQRVSRAIDPNCAARDRRITSAGRVHTLVTSRCLGLGNQGLLASLPFDQCEDQLAAKQGLSRILCCTDPTYVCMSSV